MVGIWIALQFDKTADGGHITGGTNRHNSIIRSFIMEKLNVKSNKVNRQIDIPAPAVLSMNGQALIDTLGMETVNAYLIDKIKIATRAKVRNMLEKTGQDELSDDDILNAETWKDFVPQHQERADKAAKVTADLKKLTPEQLQQVLKDAGLA